MTGPGRTLAWFSCGAASAVAAHQALKRDREALVLYCDTMEAEHPDNARFFSDVQEWLGTTITKLSSTKYASVDDVFEKTRYMAGVSGARCTVEMKKVPRFGFQQPGDVHVFGFTADEKNRADRFVENADVDVWFPLVEDRITKEDCLQVLRSAGIAIPEMYRLGYKNNNCLGCVKATSANYWNMVRRDFPDVFDKRAAQSREIGVRLTRVRGERVFLDELPEDYIPAEPLEDVSCGPDCRGVDEGPRQQSLFTWGSA
jgi:hypothetical protein